MISGALVQAMTGDSYQDQNLGNKEFQLSHRLSQKSGIFYLLNLVRIMSGCQDGSRTKQ